MKIGDLIKDKMYPEVGLIIKMRCHEHVEYALVIEGGRKPQWFSKDYILEDCEVISETR